MNDVLKFLSKSLRPFGYHIRPVRGKNMLHVPNVSYEPSIANLVKTQGRTFGEFTPHLDDMTVYLRTCLRENRNIDARPRVSGASVSDTAFVCIRSLVQAINGAKDKGDLRLVVMDDHSDPHLLDRIRNITADAEVPVEVIALSKQGQGASLYAQFDHARQDAKGFCYFVEDDYLHEPDAIDKIWGFMRHIAQTCRCHAVIYPQEHRVLYRDHYPSLIIEGEDRHWRTMRNATHTLALHSDIVRDQWDKFENTKYVGDRKLRQKGSEAKTTDRLFESIPGFSPLRPLAVHLQFEGTLPPLYDWTPLWQRYANKEIGQKHDS